MSRWPNMPSITPELRAALEAFCRVRPQEAAHRPLYAWYGDDFTGSTDVLEALGVHGVKSVLFTPHAGCA